MMSAPDEGKKRSGLINVDRRTKASPEETSKIMTKRRRDRATRRSQEANPDKLKRNDLLVGKGHRVKKKAMSDKERQADIDSRMQDSKRNKQGENQK